MRPELQAIADKITLYILTKAVASPNPALVSAAKHAEIENQILAYLDSLPEATAFEPILENEYGTHPAFDTQAEINAYLLSGGTYTPSTLPISGLTATVLSDNSIQLTWTNPN